MPEEDYEPKISTPEAIVLMLTCLFFDGLDALATYLDIAFFAGELVKEFIDLIASSILLVWATLKGMGKLRTLVGGILEAIPIASTLPI